MAEPGALRAEPEGVQMRGIGWGISLIVAGIAFCLVSAWLFSAWTGNRNGTNNVLPSSWPAPALKSGPVSERTAYFREKENRLNTYGWVDPAAGRAHIPIDQAMELLVREGTVRGPNGAAK